MKSKTFRILAAFSLLFCVVTFLAALRGIWRYDHIYVAWQRHAVTCITSDGLMRFQYFITREGEDGTGSEWRSAPNDVQWHPYWGWPNNSFINNIGIGIEIQNSQYMNCILPFWLVCILTAILPALWSRPWWWNRALQPAARWVIARPWRQYRYRHWFVRTVQSLLTLAFLASLMLWGLSYRSPHTLTLTWFHQYHLTWENGTAYLARRTGIMFTRRTQSVPFPYSDRPNLNFETSYSPFAGYITNPYTPTLPTWGFFNATPGMINGNSTCYLNVLAFPAWILTLLLLPGPLWFYFTRSRFTLPNHCSACGYNLTGNPNATACPECGKPADPARLTSGLRHEPQA
jgi:hypothetical protein